MRVLVTGGSGHVGGAVAARLAAEGHEVVVLSRRLTRSTRRFASAVAADVGRPGLAARLISQQPRCDAIVHAAAAIEADAFASSISLTNCLGTQQIVELAAAWEVTGLVFLSSVPVVGCPTVLPITEEHPIAPATAYHASKFYGERLMAVARGDGRPAISLRLTAPIGPGMPEGRILSVFVRRALAGEPLEVAGRGDRGQDYVDVRDIAGAVSAALGRGANGVVNIASGRCVSNLELARLCVASLDSSSEVRLTGAPDDQDGVRWEVSIAKAQQTLDYRPHYSLEASIAAVADHVRGATSGG